MMADIDAHVIRDEEFPDRVIGYVWPADRDCVDYVLAQPSDHEQYDGRSNWCWIRLRDGSLVLATYPQGDTYITMDDDERNKMPEALQEDMNAVKRASAHLRALVEGEDG